MKKRIYLFFIFVLLFSLCGCGNSLEIDKLKVEQNRENKEIESIEKNYNANIDIVKYFNTKLLQIVEEKSIGFSEMDFVELQEYITVGRSLYETFDYMYEKSQEGNDLYITSSDRFLTLSIYPFLDSDSGNILDYLYIEDGVNSYVLTLYWEKGKIVEFNLE